MAVQATGAMAIIPPTSRRFTRPMSRRGLVHLVGADRVVMLAAGSAARSILRFVSERVMVGFITAVGVNIILGERPTSPATRPDGANRVIRALDTLDPPGQLHLPPPRSDW